MRYRDTAGTSTSEPHFSIRFSHCTYFIVRVCWAVLCCTVPCLHIMYILNGLRTCWSITNIALHCIALHCAHCTYRASHFSIASCVREIWLNPPPSSSSSSFSSSSSSSSASSSFFYYYFSASLTGYLRCSHFCTISHWTNRQTAKHTHAHKTV